MIFILLCIYLHVSYSLLFSRLFFKKPVVFEKENIGIVLFPGYGKSSSCYKDLCNKIDYNLKKSNIYSHFIMNDYYNNVPSERFANMYYMKVLSPQLCYELIHLYF